MLDTSLPTLPSPSVSVPSRDDAEHRLLELRREADRDLAAVTALEQIMRGAGPADLQTLLAKACSWAEGELGTPAMLQQVRQSAMQALRVFLEENPPVTPTLTPIRVLIQEVQVRAEDNGARLVFDLPAEVRQWFQTPSMISF